MNLRNVTRLFYVRQQQETFTIFQPYSQSAGNIIGTANIFFPPPPIPFFLSLIPSSFLCSLKSVQISYYNSLITSICIAHCLFPKHHLENALHSIIISSHMTFFLSFKHVKFRVFVFLLSALNILSPDFCLVDYLFIIWGFI